MTHDMATERTLRRDGLDRHHARTQVRAGRWQRVHRGVWCTHTGPLPYITRCAAAVAGAGRGARIDSVSALALLGMTPRSVTDDRVHVVVPYGRAVARLGPGVVIRRSRTLTARSHLLRRGLPVIRAERAFVTLALERPNLARAVLTEAVQQGHTTVARLRSVLLALGPVGGRTRLLALLADVEGGSRSVLEAAFARLVRRAGLPALTRDHPIVAGDRRAWLDACYPERRIAVEVDGKAFHVLAEDWEDDLDRQNAIVLAGWLMLRFTARAIRERPHEVVAALRAALALAA